MFMKNILKNKIVVLAAAVALLSSCNKGFEEVPSAVTTPVSNQNLAEKLNTDPNYSIFRDAMLKYGLMTRLGNPGSAFTVLAMDNPTMTAVLGGFGLTPAQFSGLPAGQPAALAPVFAYHVIPQGVPAANIPTSYSAATSFYPAQIPNAQLPSSLQIGVTSGLPVMMNAFLAKSGANAFANNIPITGPDAIVANNGVLHKLAGPVLPPSKTLRDTIFNEPNLTLLKAIINRADSGQVAGGTARIEDLLAIPAGVNFTVFAPNNNSIKGLINALSGGLVPLAAPDAVFIGFIGANLPVQTARGVAFYHLLGTTNRTFSVNLPATTTLVKTMLNNGIPAHPGLTIDRSTAAPRLLGLGNGAGNFSNFVVTDRNAINGVFHIIDRVLMPQ